MINDLELLRLRARGQRIWTAARLSVDSLLRAVHSIGTNSSSTVSPSSASPIEHLEKRQLLSSVYVDNGVLTIKGDSDAQNTIRVSVDGNDYVAKVNSTTKTYSRSSVSSIDITGGDEDDAIDLTSDVKIRSVISGLEGDDSIRGGSGADSINGNDGDDSLWGMNGNDTINGNWGNDYINVSDGDDQAYGGDGNDSIAGYAGDDRLWGQDGNDSLDGGSGDDTVLGHGGTNQVTGGTGNDIVVANDGSTTPTNPSDPSNPPGSPTEPSNPPPTQGESTSDGWTTVKGSNANGAAPQLTISLLGQEIIAGQQVFVNALSSTISTGTPLTAKYDWDFGDTSGKYNDLRGWSAGHAYDKAGTYTLTLTVTDEDGNVSKLSTSVVVESDNRRTIYVAADGNDANDGSSPNSAIKSVARINQLMGKSSNLKVLFNRGDKFNFDRTMEVNGKNVTIGAYGSGDRPLIYRLDGNGAGCISIYQTAVNSVVRDLVFDSPNVPKGNSAPAFAMHAIYAGGQNVSVRGCEFLNVNYAIDAFRAPEGLLVQDNDAPLPTGLRGYLVWGEGSDHVYLGNYAANSTREHIFRLVNVTRILIADNDLTNLDRSNVDGPDTSKGCIEVHNGSWAYISENKVTDGALRIGPRGGDSEPSSTKTDWVVIERNEVHQVAIRVNPGSQNAFIRNNVIERGDGGACIEIEARDADGRVVKDITIANNTGYNPNQGGKFLRVQGTTQRVTLVNNLYVMPKLYTGDGSGSVYIAADDLSGFSSITNNVWQKPDKIILWAEGGVNWVKANFDSREGYQTPEEWDAFAQVGHDTFEDTVISGWTPSSNSVAAAFAKALPGVFEDYYGNSRPLTGSITAGAVEV